MGSTPADLKHDPDFDHQPDELAELRALLLGQQIIELQKLQKRLDEPDLRAEEISQVLGKAIALSLKRDHSLQRSFYPIVEQALQISVARNPAFLATSLAPIIGESVRKSVANAFRNLAENINLMLERSLSFESMKWRFEAMRTGKSFGEIALLRSLRYRVQQVFLIHRETGLVLQHVSAPGEGVSEAELVSGMLTAIQDFVRDSFTSKHSQDLETMQAGEFLIWVHHGPKALLAGTILGTPPPELRNVFAREDELIHQEFAAELTSFNGDASAFDAARPHLQKCLLGQTSRPQRGAWFALGAFALVVLLLVGTALLAHRRSARWQQYLTQLNHTDGIAVTGAESSWGHYWVWGLRDPMSPDPVKLAAEAGIPADSLNVHFEPYQSLQEHFQYLRDFATESRRLEQQMVLFPVNSSVLTADQSIRIDNIEESLDRLQQTADKLRRGLHVVVYGRADQTGAETKNATLSEQRAQSVYDALRERGIPAETISAVGLGNTKPIHHGSATYQLEVNRSVTLKVQSQSQGESQ
jgi:outer membrane protein OmpA-like peptidoglycan-associated protein